jgi:hypothetical protein
MQQALFVSDMNQGTLFHALVDGCNASQVIQPPHTTLPYNCVHRGLPKAQALDQKLPHFVDQARIIRDEATTCLLHGAPQLAATKWGQVKGGQVALSHVPKVRQPLNAKGTQGRSAPRQLPHIEPGLHLIPGRADQRGVPEQLHPLPLEISHVRCPRPLALTHICAGLLQG